VVIVGAARQGLALARYLLFHNAKVTITDKRPLEELDSARIVLQSLSEAGYVFQLVCGEHPDYLLDYADLLCLSGGVPPDIPLVLEAKKRGIPLSNDSQIFLEAAPCKVIGITGSAGKTTTTSLVGQIAKEAVDQPEGDRPYRQSWTGGNIGLPLISVLDDMKIDDLAIMELSSFQLEIMDCSPHIAAILNVTPNHLDRHSSMEAYTAAKARILLFQSQDDIAILGRDDPGAMKLNNEVFGQLFTFGFSAPDENQYGAYIDKESILLRMPDEFSRIIQSEKQVNDSNETSFVMEMSDVVLRGDHNLLNTMAACVISAAAGLPIHAMQAGIKGFTGIPHRLELVRRWRGVDWYNDSIATAPERVIAAIRSFDEPLVLLAGGRDKNLTWEEFAKFVWKRVDHLILFGEASDLIHQAMIQSGSGGCTLTRCENLKCAVDTAAQIAQPGDVVLLSPGGTSFDEFNDFEERGDRFKQWVRELP